MTITARIPALRTALRSLALAGAATLVVLSASGSAEAGRRTGTWKYSPEEVYAAQRAQRYRGERGYGQRYGRGYDQGYGRQQQQDYGRAYGRPQRGYGPPPRPYGVPSVPEIAGPGGGGPGTYGRP